MSADDLGDRLLERLLLFLLQLPEPADHERGFDRGDDRFHDRGLDEPCALPVLDLRSKRGQARIKAEKPSPNAPKNKGEE